MKNFGSRMNLLWGISGLCMIIGIGLGNLSVGYKLFIIGLIMGFIFSQLEINRLKKISIRKGNIIY